MKSRGMSRPALRCSVLCAAPQAVWLPDGSAVQLHHVDTLSARARHLRALRTASGWLVFDIARVAPELAEELPTAREHDVPGLVLYALRAVCPTAAALLASAKAAADTALTRLANAENDAEATC